jgi:hypothetical protein
VPLKFPPTLPFVSSNFPVDGELVVNVTNSFFVTVCHVVGGRPPSQLPICHTKQVVGGGETKLPISPTLCRSISTHESQKVIDTAKVRPLLCLLWATIIGVSTGCV